MSRSIIFLVLAAAAAAVLILTGHGPHAIGTPYLILLACPLMPMFMHYGHGGPHRRRQPRHH